ncbi:MAG TPA: hypothetical protein VK081_09265, partial [Planctomycetota bacterium]|nr:hypothetical protein [Planctomycetota bacterium]
VLATAAVGWVRGWFTASPAEAGGKSGFVLTWDADKFKADWGKAGDKLKELSRAAADKIKGAAKKISDDESELEGKVSSVDVENHTITLDVGGERIPLVAPDATGIESLPGKDVRVVVVQSNGGYVVRKVEEKK